MDVFRAKLNGSSYCRGQSTRRDHKPYEPYKLYELYTSSFSFIIVNRFSFSIVLRKFAP